MGLWRFFKVKENTNKNTIMKSLTTVAQVTELQ